MSAVYKRADNEILNNIRDYLLKELDEPYTNKHLEIIVEGNIIYIPETGCGIFDHLIDLINAASPILAAVINDEYGYGGCSTFSIDTDIIYGLLNGAHERVYAIIMCAIAKIKNNIDVITNYKTNLSHLFYRGFLGINYYDADYLEPIIETKMSDPYNLYPWDGRPNHERELACRQYWILQKLEKIIDNAIGDRDRHKWIHERLVSSSELIKKLPRNRPIGQGFFDEIIEGEKFDDMVKRWKTEGRCITGKVCDKIHAEETKAFLASRKAYFDDIEQKKTKKEEIAALRKRLQELEKEIPDA